MTDPPAAGQIPLVDYLALGDSPHLVAHECTACGERFFDRRNACAKCFATEFKDADVATDGIVNAFTIVAFAAPGRPGAVRVGGRRLRRHAGAGEHHQRRAVTASTCRSA